jgi:hypothetical protein
MDGLFGTEAAFSLLFAAGEIHSQSRPMHVCPLKAHGLRPVGSSRDIRRLSRERHHHPVHFFHRCDSRFHLVHRRGLQRFHPL